MSRFDSYSDKDLFFLAGSIVLESKNLEALGSELLWALSERISRVRYELLCVENSKEVSSEKKKNEG